MRNKILVAIAAATAAGAASAQTTFDVSDITGAETSLLAIGAAVFSVAVVIKLYKWARRAL